MAEQKIILTEAEKDKLEAERRNLIDVVRPEVIEALALARSQGDLSENADYDAARDRQAPVEARIAEIERILHNATIVRKSNGNVAGIGDIVVFLPAGAEEPLSVHIAGNTGADPMADIPVVSNESPLGQALLGKGIGEEVLVDVEEPYKVRILEIRK